MKHFKKSVRNMCNINTPLIMYFQGGRHVKKFHLKFHFLGGGDGSVEDVGVNGAEVL